MIELIFRRRLPTTSRRTSFSLQIRLPPSRKVRQGDTRIRKIRRRVLHPRSCFVDDRRTCDLGKCVLHGHNGKNAIIAANSLSRRKYESYYCSAVVGEGLVVATTTTTITRNKRGCIRSSSEFPSRPGGRTPLTCARFVFFFFYK